MATALEWITALGSVGTFVGVGIAVWELWQHKRTAQAEFFWKLSWEAWDDDTTEIYYRIICKELKPKDLSSAEGMRKLDGLLTWCNLVRFLGRSLRRVDRDSLDKIIKDIISDDTVKGYMLEKVRGYWPHLDKQLA